MARVSCSRARPSDSPGRARRSCRLAAPGVVVFDDRPPVHVVSELAVHVAVGPRSCSRKPSSRSGCCHSQPFTRASICPESTTTTRWPWGRGWPCVVAAARQVLHVHLVAMENRCVCSAVVQQQPVARTRAGPRVQEHRTARVSLIVDLIAKRALTRVRTRSLLCASRRRNSRSVFGKGVGELLGVVVVALRGGFLSHAGEILRGGSTFSARSRLANDSPLLRPCAQLRAPSSMDSPSRRRRATSSARRER